MSLSKGFERAQWAVQPTGGTSVTKDLITAVQQWTIESSNIALLELSQQKHLTDNFFFRRMAKVRMSTEGQRSDMNTW
jgi:hypothetical protein